MALDPKYAEQLEARAKEVGAKIGRELTFRILGNDEYVAITAAPDNQVILGPSKLSDLAAQEFDLDLDAIERGDRVVFEDPEGIIRVRESE